MPQIVKTYVRELCNRERSIERVPKVPVVERRSIRRREDELVRSNPAGPPRTRSAPAIVTR
jgi:hypothetical protein